MSEESGEERATQSMHRLIREEEEEEVLLLICSCRVSGTTTAAADDGRNECTHLGAKWSCKVDDGSGSASKSFAAAAAC